MLTSDSAGIPVGSLSPNPALTNVNGSSGLPCTTGCIISGPPSPPGTDAYTITLYDNTGGTGNALDLASTGPVAIVEGAANSNSLTLNGIPALLVLSTLPATWPPNATNSTTATLQVEDADSEVITGTFANSVTVADNDTNSDGTAVVGSSSSCPSQTTPSNSSSGNKTSVTFTSNATTNTFKFCYLGLQEATATLTASASAGGVTPVTQNFTPSTYNTPAAGTTAGVFVGTDAQLEATTGADASGTIAYTETGFTNAPYEQVLSVDTGSSLFTCNPGGPLSTFATVTPSLSSGTTVFTVASASPYTPGKCTIPVWDGISGAYTPPTFTASYTTSGFTVDAHGRK
jgi:hypothetical protein